MIILGISSYHPDASAALVVDGEIVSAIDEERLNRIKHSPGFPELAIKHCLEQAKITLDDVDYISVANDFKVNLWRKFAFAVNTFPVKAWPRYFHNYMRQRILRPLNVIDDLAERVGGDPKKIASKVKRVEHHNAHAASSYYTSPFTKASILTMDGSGDFVTCAFSYGDGSSIRRLGQTYWPNSLGMLYFSVTQHLGFHELGAEGKVMALASFGKPKYMDEFRQIVKLTPEGFKMDMDYFTFHLPVLIDNWGDPTTASFFIYQDWLSKKFHSLFGPPRMPGSDYTQKHMDIAASLQLMLEETVFHLLKLLHNETGGDDLCLSGGVALNCVMNGKVTANTPFKRVFVQPNAGDGGLSLGSALHLYHHQLVMPKKHAIHSAALGTEYSNKDVRSALDSANLKYVRHDDITPHIANHIASGKVIGWFQGKMEFGPRALGNRSILADPRRPDMKDFINSRVKHREHFRPFAPSVLEEDAKTFFNLNGFPSPYMLLAVDVRSERAQQVPAITHVDGTARVQTVDKSANPKYRRLIEEFKKITGIPLLLNTSFNLKGEPVVSSPQDAIKSFLATRIDVLAIEDFIVEKQQ
ncbi:MAG: carbamoyltransferase [Deltaproteobacteria bacterium]|nr:carbamoyltransferase [Deltaproteobacteria bacterium]